MFEPEKFIPCVEKHPCLWDPHNEDYHSREAKDSAWEQICSEVIPDYKKYPARSLSTELKKKWTNIRDYYRKEVQKSGVERKKSKKYVYAHLLEFLTPQFIDRNENDEEGEVLELNTQSDNEVDDIEQESNMSEEPDISNPVSLHKQKATSSSDVEDDTNFLLSLRGYIKNMNFAQKINFKMGILELVKNISTADTKLQEQEIMQYHPRGNRKRKLGDSKLSMEPGKSNIGSYVSVDQEEADVFGKYVSLELKKLQITQQAIAQKLTSEVIYYAKMEKLIPGSNLKIEEHNDPLLTQFRSTNTEHMTPEYIKHEEALNEDKFNPQSDD